MKKYGVKSMKGKNAKSILAASKREKDNLKKTVIRGDINEPEACIDWGVIKTYIPANYVEHGGGKMEHFYVVVEPGHKFPSHIHPTSDQLILVLGGEGKLDLNGKKFDLHKGIVHHILAGQWHNYDTEKSNKRLELFLVASPPLTFCIREDGFDSFNEEEWKKMGYSM